MSDIELSVSMWKYYKPEEVPPELLKLCKSIPQYTFAKGFYLGLKTGDQARTKLSARDEAIKVMKNALEGLEHLEYRFITEGYFPGHPGYGSRTETKTNIAKEALAKVKEILGES